MIVKNITTYSVIIYLKKVEFNSGINSYGKLLLVKNIRPYLIYRPLNNMIKFSIYVDTIQIIPCFCFFFLSLSIKKKPT